MALALRVVVDQLNAGEMVPSAVDDLFAAA
jgi:hypothetical protein